jgi:hypothetical protein
MATALPNHIAALFWEVDSTTVELDAHRDYVLERVMVRGGWEAMKWLRRTFDRDQIASFLKRRGSRLPPRELAYWATMIGIEVPVSPSGGRPPWAGQ